MTAVTPTDRPKSVRYRCVIEVFGGVFYVVTMLFGFFCGCMGVCHRTESDLFLFVLQGLVYSMPQYSFKGQFYHFRTNRMVGRILNDIYV